MDLSDKEMIVNLEYVKAGFFDIINFIITDEGSNLHLDDAVTILQMALKVIESVGVR